MPGSRAPPSSPAAARADNRAVAWVAGGLARAVYYFASATWVRPYCGPMNLEKANRKEAKAQRLAKTIHCMVPMVLPDGEPIGIDFPLRSSASLRLCGYELRLLG